MLKKPDIKKLIKQRIKDAEALLNNRCYFSSMYLGGYAIELALKYSICNMYKFKSGFPETPQEFNLYVKNPNFPQWQNKNLGPIITKLKEIKTHDLPKLLKYSGHEVNVIQNYTREWSTTFSWNPEMRYRVNVIKKSTAQNYLDSIKTIIKSINL